MSDIMERDEFIIKKAVEKIEYMCAQITKTLEKSAARRKASNSQTERGAE